MEQGHDSTVAFDVEGGIAWVRFNRPEKRNCMSPALNRRMMEVLDELSALVEARIGAAER